jgi:hypothetical protein
MARPRNTPNIDQKRVDKLQAQGLTVAGIARELGVTVGQVADAVYEAEVNNDPDLEVNGTPKAMGKQIIALRENGVRWERIRIYADRPIPELKELMKDAGGDPEKKTTKPGRKAAEKNGDGNGASGSASTRRRGRPTNAERAARNASDGKGKEEEEQPRRRGRPSNRTRADRQAASGSRSPS